MSEGLPDLSVKSSITIPIEKYEELMQDSLLLSALHAAGIDNWDGYDIAQDLRDELETERA